MEQVLEVYQRPHNPQRPVVNMDDQHQQLIAETRQTIPASPGCAERIDYEYVRQGACVIWMFVDALGGWRNVTVTENRTAGDWARQVQQLVDQPRHAAAERITLVCDNLNTHTLNSLDHAFPQEEALRIARRMEIVHTPKHGSWLNIAASELSVLTRQCLDRRMPEQQRVADEACQWTENRNARQVSVAWQFRTDDARIRLKRLHPDVKA